MALALLCLREGVQRHLGDMIAVVVGVMVDQEDVTQCVAERGGEQETERCQSLILTI